MMYPRILPDPPNEFERGRGARARVGVRAYQLFSTPRERCGAIVALSPEGDRRPSPSALLGSIVAGREEGEVVASGREEGVARM